MSRKSNNLFSILVIPLSIKRDNIIANVLEDKEPEYNNKKYIGAGGPYGIFYSENLSFIKTWKTEKGASNFLENIIKKSDVKVNGLFSETRGDNVSSDWDNITYKVVHIEKEWNKYIDNKIIETTKKYTQRICELNKMKV